MGTQTAAIDNTALTTNAAASTTNTVDLKTENSEYRVYANLDKEGNVIRDNKKRGDRELVNVADFAKWENDRKERNEKEGKGITTALEVQQSIRKYKVATVEGFLQLITDPEEQVNIINRGISAKFSQKVNSYMLEEDENGNLVFQPVEGAFDSAEWLQEETVRKNLTAVEKVNRDIKKNIQNMTQDDMASVIAMLEQLKAAQAAQATQAS